MSKEELYNILEIPKTASDDEIKKAYKKAALKHHPDRNPNNPDATAKFQEVGKAFATLNDPQKRQRYDQFGIIDGENDGPGGGGGMPGGFNPFDMFQNMFGGGGFPGMNMNMNMNMNNQNNQKRSFKSPDKKVTINLSLADVYKGKSVSIDFNKTLCCDKCNGCGALSKEHIQSCKTCNGQGKVMKMVQMGPMIQQSIQHCANCKGIGKMVEQGKNCIKCNGNKTMTIKKHLDCYVRPGSAPGTSITFKNEADWIPDCSDIGDLIVFVNCKNEEGCFRREGNNLIMKKSISLLEALTNTIIYFKHLDDRVIRIKYNEIIKPNQKMYIKDEGMSDLNGGNNGNLLIYFDIIFPDTLEQDRSKYLVKILPIPKKQIWDLQLESTPDTNITDKLMYIFNDDHKSKSKNMNINNDINDINDINNINDDDIFNNEDNEIPNMGGRQQVECATQ
jgi:DnaJ-class molecular chaperone